MKLKIILLSMFLLTSCQTSDEETWTPTTWTINHYTQNLRHDKEKISCSDRRARDFVCMPHRDVVQLMKICTEPRPWYETIFN